MVFIFFSRNFFTSYNERILLERIFLKNNEGLKRILIILFFFASHFFHVL
nr:MAG TPA: hypothetical protein [Caudoviricetes sp.]